MIDEYLYHPKDKPIPDGWELVSTLENTPHGFYSVLIKKKLDRDLLSRLF